MSSILTNVSAMNAVSSLTATQNALADTQNQISTGLAVSTAEENASYWSIATSMRSDVGALSAVSDSINLGSSVVSTAYSALSQSISILNQMKNLIVDAQTAGQNPATIDTQLEQLQQQLRTFANTATFNGVNLLATGSSTPEAVVTSFSKNSSGIDTIGFTTISLTVPLYSTADGSQGSSASTYTGADGYTGTGLLDSASSSTGYSIDNLSVTGPGPSATDTTTTSLLTDEQNQVETAILSLTTAASQLGSVLSNLTEQGTFTAALSNSLTSGIGSLVDADMNQASTRLNALQTQQQLGIQSLSIANTNSQLILKLFGG